MATSTVIQTCPGLALAVAAAAIADTAITLPTDRSMPPVRMTSVWPRAISANGAAATRMVIRLSACGESCAAVAEVGDHQEHHDHHRVAQENARKAIAGRTV